MPYTDCYAISAPIPATYLSGPPHKFSFSPAGEFIYLMTTDWPTSTDYDIYQLDFPAMTGATLIDTISIPNGGSPSADHDINLVTFPDGTLYAVTSCSPVSVLDHDLWEVGVGHIASFMPSPLGFWQAWVYNPDGFMYGASRGADASLIGRLTTSGTFTTVATDEDVHPFSLIAASDGALWYSAIDGGAIHRVDSGGDDATSAPFSNFRNLAPLSDGSVRYEAADDDGYRIASDGSYATDSCVDIPGSSAYDNFLGGLVYTTSPGWQESWYASIGDFDNIVIMYPREPDPVGSGHGWSAIWT